MSRVPMLHGGVLGERQLERVLWTPLSVFVTSARLTVLVSFSAHRYNIISDCLSDYLYQCCADVCHFVRFVQRYVGVVCGVRTWGMVPTCCDMYSTCHIALHHDLLLQIGKFLILSEGVGHVQLPCGYQETWHLEIFWSSCFRTTHTFSARLRW